MSDNLPQISSVSLEEEMKKSYLDYAMSVIVSRALPDARDGLKPVHRRILYSMYDKGLDHNRAHRKSANVVGYVMGDYHPHGDMAIYNALARMAQEFSMRLTLIDGQGNFGSMDGDPPAASRYTEARLSHPAHFLLEDIDKKTVEFQPTYDERLLEPVVLPARFPNLLVNGAGGIAVGMATNIPPHNLGEVIDGCVAYIDNPEITTEELNQYILGPDFPTGGEILGQEGILTAYRTGQYPIIMRAKSHFEQTSKDRDAIIITEVPYQANKAKIMEKIAELVNTKVIEGISDLRDESDRHGIRMVIELKRDTDPNVALNLLHKHTPLQDTFGINMLALDGGRPAVMTLRDIIKSFVDFRYDVVIRRTRYKLMKARERGHVLAGLAIAVANIDEVIALIRKAPDPTTAKEHLIGRSWSVHTMGTLLELIEPRPEGSDPLTTYTLSEIQAKSILELRLHRLTGLERDQIATELEAVVEEIKGYIFTLSHATEIFRIIKEEMMEIKEKFATPRRTQIIEGALNADMESLIQKEDMVITVSHAGYIKRVPLSTYRAQRRGGRGRTGMATRDEDFVEQMFVANTHTPIIFFSSLGKAYVLKVYRLPLATATSKGKALVNMLPLDQGEKISTIMPLTDTEDPKNLHDLHIMFATSKGNVRKNLLADFLNIRSNGKIAMKLDESETLVSVVICHDDTDILLSTYQGRCIRFSSTDIRVFSGRNSNGVRGIKLQGDDCVVSMCILKHGSFTTEERDLYLRQVRAQRGVEAVDDGTPIPFDTTLPEARFKEMAEQEEFILTVSEKGYGKRTSSYEYRITGRGGQGITNMDITDKTGLIVACFPVSGENHLMLVTDGGQLIRSRVNEIRIAGRRTQGVRLFRLSDSESVVSAERIFDESSEEGQESLESDATKLT